MHKYTILHTKALLLQSLLSVIPIKEGFIA